MCDQLAPGQLGFPRVGRRGGGFPDGGGVDTRDAVRGRFVEQLTGHQQHHRPGAGPQGPPESWPAGLALIGRELAWLRPGLGAPQELYTNYHAAGMGNHAERADGTDNKKLKHGEPHGGAQDGHGARRQAQQAPRSGDRAPVFGAPGQRNKQPRIQHERR